MKKIIYIPTKVEDELPEDNTIQFELCGKNKSVGWYQNGVRQHAGATEWLKPTEANVFTDEQLLELKKEWCSEFAEKISNHKLDFQTANNGGWIGLDMETITSEQLYDKINNHS